MLTRVVRLFAVCAWVCAAMGSDVDPEGDQRRRPMWGFAMIGVAKDQSEDRLSTNTVSPETQGAWEGFLASRPGASAAQKLLVLRGLIGHRSLEATKE